MGALEWLGLKKGKSKHPHLSAIQRAFRDLLPDDEPVVIRYIVIVSVLLTRVAQADGRVLACELEHIRALFQHLDRLPPTSIDDLCAILNDAVSRLSSDELDLVYRELRALCDADERVQVLRLLAAMAIADGKIAAAEHNELVDVAAALAIDDDSLEAIEIEALTQRSSLTPDSVPELADTDLDPSRA